MLLGIIVKLRGYAKNCNSFLSVPLLPFLLVTHSLGSTDSPTNDTTDSEDYEDANEDTASSTLSKSDDSFENQAQNLEQHLHIPEVQAAVNDMIEDLRNFNKQHPVPLCVSMNHCAHARAPLRRSTRNVERPESYATYNRTGKKK